MKNYFSIIILFCFIAQSCSSQPEISRKEVTFKIIQKTSLEVDSLFPDVQTSFHAILNNEFGYYDMVAPNIRTYLRFDTTGKLRNAIAKKNIVNNHLLPTDGYFPSGFDYHQDTLFLLYPTGSVYKIYDNKITATIKLQIPNGDIIVRETPFYYVPENNTFLLSLGKDVETTKDFFKNSVPFSIFDASGKLIKSFGAYPKQYAQGVHIDGSMGFTKKLREDKSFYCLYPHFSQMYEYDFKGNLLRSIKLPESELRDTIFKVSNKSLENLKTRAEQDKIRNDAYRGGIAKAKGKNIFYYSFFSHSKKQETICRYDADKKVFSEMNAKKAMSFVSLFPLAKENSCCFLATNSQSDEVYIYEVAFE